jgi:lysophospholipase L1-like esterase
MERDDLKFLAFGASLTEGYFNGGRNFHPYAEQLEVCIDRRLQELQYGNQVWIHQFGKSGECTTNMIPRLWDILCKSKSCPYNFVCIIAGTNDLNHGESSNDISKRLEQLYGMVLQHSDSTILVAGSIPDSEIVDSDYVTRRKAVNARIKTYCESINSERNSNRCVFVDIEHNIPYFTEDGVRNSNIWDDAIHLNPAGYDRLGELIYSHIESYLS